MAHVGNYVFMRLRLCKREAIETEKRNEANLCQEFYLRGITEHHVGQEEKINKK